MRHSLRLRLGGVVAAVILAAFTAQVFAAPAGATSPGRNGRIAFARALRYGTQPPWVVYSIRADGSGIKKLVSDAVSPAWSPDGTLLAYVNYRWDGTPRAIWVMNADGSGRHQVTHPDPETQQDGSPTWSPDGSRIAFIRPDAAGPEMWMVNADGTGLMQVTTDGLAQDAAWAPSGNRIALTRWNSSRTSMGVWVINADGTGARQITPPSLRAREPAWSPNGRWIAFTADKGSDNGIRLAVSVIRADGSGLRRLTPYEGNGEPCWSPDGSRIAFGSVRSGANKIWIMRTDGTDVHQVTWLANTSDAGCDWRAIPS